MDTMAKGCVERRTRRWICPASKTFGLLLVKRSWSNCVSPAQHVHPILPQADLRTAAETEDEHEFALTIARLEHELGEIEK